MLSPVTRVNSGPTYSSDRPVVSRTESERYVRQYRQQGKHYISIKFKYKANIALDGYISFPDFEKFCQSQNPYDQHRESAVKT
jgi:hypothetical protein